MVLKWFPWSNKPRARQRETDWKGLFLSLDQQKQILVKKILIKWSESNRKGRAFIEVTLCWFTRFPLKWRLEYNDETNESSSICLKECKACSNQIIIYCY